MWSIRRLECRPTAMSNQARVSHGLLWIFIALYVFMGAARLLHNPRLQRLTPFISVAILMGFAIVHGIRRYGWTHLVVFFIVAFVISWSYETLSILTGFPFGRYVYTDNLGPKLWLVPLILATQTSLGRRSAGVRTNIAAHLTPSAPAVRLPPRVRACRLPGVVCLASRAGTARRSVRECRTCR